MSICVLDCLLHIKNSFYYINILRNSSNIHVHSFPSNPFLSIPLHSFICCLFIVSIHFYSVPSIPLPFHSFPLRVVWLKRLWLTWFVFAMVRRRKYAVVYWSVSNRNWLRHVNAGLHNDFRKAYRRMLYQRDKEPLRTWKVVLCIPKFRCADGRTQTLWLEAFDWWGYIVHLLLFWGCPLHTKAALKNLYIYTRYRRGSPLNILGAMHGFFVISNFVTQAILTSDYYSKVEFAASDACKNQHHGVQKNHFSDLARLRLSRPSRLARLSRRRCYVKNSHYVDLARLS